MLGRDMRGLLPFLMAEIATRGNMSFARFMDLALYDPTHGYYARPGRRTGCHGDFFTNVDVGSVFGELLAGEFLAMRELLGCPPDFTIVEQGSHDGRLARDILNTLENKAIRYAIIEPLPMLREIQSTVLAARNVEWYASAEELPGFTGVHFSNELFDALPVHVVRSTGTDWLEMCVGISGDKFEWTPAAPGPGLAAAVADLPVRPEGYTTEVRLSHRPLLASLSRKIQTGFLLALDYGMSAGSLLDPHRSGGTLSCYRNHRRDDAPLLDPGDKDITAHVDFSSLARDAEEVGFQLRAFTDQHHFLIGSASRMLLAMDGSTPPPALAKKLRTLRTLMHPESMGTQFHALLLSKNFPAAATLPGFQHARDARSVLFG